MEKTIKEKHRHFLLLLSTLLFLFSNQLYAQYFKHLGMKEGLSQLSVLSIYQDELGRMWFGTREGVNVYDGKHITVYKPWTMDMSRKSNNLPAGNIVKTIVGNQHGDIYMDVDGALVRYDLYKEKFTRLNHTGLQALATEGNEVWGIFDNSLFKCNSDSLTFQQKLDVPYITCFLKSGKTLWVGTLHGLYLLENKTVKHFLPDIRIFSLFKSSRGELWIASYDRGLYRITQNGELVSEPHHPDSGEGVISNQIRFFAEDEQENIWFGTFNGLQMYNPYTKKYSAYQKKNRLGSLTHSSVFPVYKDNQGSIWLGTYYGGVHYFNSQKDIFTYYPHDSQRNDCLNFPLIGSMIEDKDKTLWICTDGGGLNRLNRKTGEFTYFTSSQKNSILHNNIKCICYDEKRDCIYVGTYVGGFSRYDRKTGKFHNYLEEYNKTGKGPNREVQKLLIKGNWLYITARNGFWRMDIESGEFQFLSNMISNDFIIANDEIAWIATDQGVYRIKIKPPYPAEFFKLEDKEERTFRISKILQSSTGTIYISTVGNGFYAYDEKEKSLTHYTADKSNLLSNYCYTMVETSSNNILLTSERGVSLFSPFNLSINSAEIGENNGITAIADGCGACVTNDEQIFVGGVDGMISFKESDLSKKFNNNGKLYFSTLQIHNTKIYPDDDSGVLKQSMPFVRDLELSAPQNNIIVSFSSSNYLSIYSNTRYEYKLEGFDKDWIPAVYMNLYYTNIPPGKYVLRLREKNVSKSNTPSDEQQEISLNIIVHSPWYNNVWAWICYFLVVVGSVYCMWHIKMGRKVLALSLEQEKKEKERIEELNQTKLRFFMNISHEFRTLLTLIVGQIELLMQIPKLPPSVYNRLLKVHKNAIHMRILITELLDFRKMEQGHMKLKVTSSDLVAVTQEVYLSFYELAQKKNITYLFEHGNDSLNAWFDPVQMRKVLFNLISNAFKYTPEKGKIQISISKTDKNILIEVKDSGCGISQETMDKIFERFYQVYDSRPGLTTGTGIGLSLAKGVVDAHKGNIRVTSEVGKGSIFTVSLLLGNAHFSQEELSNTYAEKPFVDDEKKISDSIDRDEMPIEIIENDANDTSELTREKPTILIVEDNVQLIEMLEDIFSPIYNVYKASNGAERFEMTRQVQPDIVLSDVMMPVMSGKEMCHKIKNNFEVSHIPVVLLTAQTTVEYMIDSYMFGVDDYITKPFNIKLLISRCNNLVNSRRALLERFKNMEKFMAKPVDGLNASDQKLMDEVSAVIRKNFENFDFDLNTLASELNMGRSKMFSRIKEITGITPNEYVLNMKLKEAGRLLKEVAEYNVAEVAYKLGFSSPRYFSRCFKSFYGVTPQAYRKAQEDNLSETDELTAQ